MKFSELKGRAVINLEDAKKMGDIEDILVEPEGRHITGLKVRTGMFHSARIVPVGDIKNVGGDAVTVAGGAVGAENGASPASSQQAIELTSLLGNKVVTDAGTMVGELSDVMIDWVDMTITGYEVHMGGLFTKAQQFADAPGVRYGNKLITIPASLLNQPN